MFKAQKRGSGLAIQTVLIATGCKQWLSRRSAYFQHLTISASVATLPGLVVLTTQQLGAKVSTTIVSEAPALVPRVQSHTIRPPIPCQANVLQDRGETNAGQW